eukprot:COSAG01_NODE_3014_length_6720_cov_157.743845_9_plen_133_part_00
MCCQSVMSVSAGPSAYYATCSRSDPSTCSHGHENSCHCVLTAVCSRTATSTAPRRSRTCIAVASPTIAGGGEVQQRLRPRAAAGASLGQPMMQSRCRLLQLVSTRAAHAGVAWRMPLRLAIRGRCRSVLCVF